MEGGQSYAYGTILYFKSKTRTLLNQLQCKGDIKEWDDRNFNLKFLEGPSWTWGLTLIE